MTSCEIAFDVLQPLVEYMQMHMHYAKIGKLICLGKTSEHFVKEIAYRCPTCHPITTEIISEFCEINKCVNSMNVAIQYQSL